MTENKKNITKTVNNKTGKKLGKDIDEVIVQN